MKRGDKKLDGTKVRDWLRNFFQSEKELVFRYLKRDSSEAKDAMSTDDKILVIMNRQGFSIDRSLLAYHRKTVMRVPGYSRRFEGYEKEWKRGNKKTA